MTGRRCQCDSSSESVRSLLPTSAGQLWRHHVSGLAVMNLLSRGLGLSRSAGVAIERVALP